jgi:hypothetical protein
MTKTLHLLMCGVVGILFFSGCASYRVLTNLKPEADAALQSPAGRFYIAGVKYINNSDFMAMNDQEYEKYLLVLVRKECLKRFPSLFAKNPAGCVPIWVDVSDSITESKKMYMWMLCTIMVTPLIFPMPAQTDRAIGVDVGVWNGTDSIAGMKLRQEFRREEHAWTSATPLALFPVPGESDLPKEYWGLINADPAKPFKNNVGYHDAPQIAQQVATAIAKQIAAKDPEFWAAQPRLNNSSIGLPTRTGETPVAPPIPTDSVTPF